MLIKDRKNSKNRQRTISVEKNNSKNIQTIMRNRLSWIFSISVLQSLRIDQDENRRNA